MSSLGRLVAMATATAIWAGCTTKTLPAGTLVVDRFDIVGSERVDDEDIEKRLATGETSRLLGGALQGIPVLGVLDTLTVEYRAFDPIVLQRDMERIRRYYRSRGFFEAQVRAGRVIALPEPGSVRVEVVVDEGLSVLLEDVSYDFDLWQQAPDANARSRDLINRYRHEGIADDEPLPRFDEERYEEAKLALLGALTDYGFAYAAVSGTVDVDLIRRRARVHFQGEAGPRCTFGPIRVEGLDEIPEEPIVRALGFAEGEEFSTAKLVAAERALADFGVFGAIQILPELGDEAGGKVETAVPVLVRVEPIKLRSVKLGIGAEVGDRVDVHGVVGWEDRNFAGGLRRFSVELRPGLVFFPMRAETLFSQVATNVLPEAGLRLHFTQPGFPESRTSLHLSATGSLSASRHNPVPHPVPEDYNILGYREITGAVGLDRIFHVQLMRDSRLYVGNFIRLQVDNPFSYNEDEPPPGLDTLVFPYMDTTVWWDQRRDEQGRLDPIHPRRGYYLGANVQFAGGLWPSDANDIRLVPEVRLYAPLPEELTVAVRFSMGFLFPGNYGDAFGLGLPIAALTPDQKAELSRDLQLMSFRGLFSGGPNSNRGYGYREVGPTFDFAALDDAATESQLRPTGGRGSWELSAELRIPLAEKVRAVVFIDASDVTNAIDALRLTHPHISPGLGVRIDTPVGPFRADLGVRVPYLQRLGEAWLSPAEGGPPDGESDDLPLALSLAIGEAY